MSTPKTGFSASSTPSPSRNILGNPGEFYTIVSGSKGERLIHIERLLHAFRENVELLIRKTWVEKHDEKRKEKVHEDLQVFVQEFQSGAVRKAFPHFVRPVPWA